MSMTRWQITRSILLLCGAITSTACDDVLEGKEDDQHEHDECDHGCSSGGGSSSGGGGTWHGGDSTGDDSDDDDTVTDDSDPDDTVDTDEAPSVAVGRGDIEGRYVNSKVRSFLGIPYAKPPVDELRFLPPQEPDKWSKPLKATAFGHNCVQGASSDLGDQDEDCLYLNVWAPARTPRQGLPVLVWFHGGDHATGSAAEPASKRLALYDGTQLAERGVVVVTVNYRLGPLGFYANKRLADDNDCAVGNQGLWDQQLALHWVSDNIGKFGGDSDNVTIAGQGSGATDVCLHAVSAESRGLFAHVIQQSGGCTTYQPTADQLESRAKAWLEKLDCDVSDVLSCLQEKSVGELYDAIPADGYSAFVPGVDGAFLKDQPRVLFDNGDFGDVSFLMGSNSEEGSQYLDQFADVKTEDEYHRVMQKYFPGIPLDELCEVYPHDRFADADNPYQVELSYVFGDGRFVCSTLDTAIRAQEAGANVYLYNFEGVDPADVGDATHGAELAYVFGTLNSPDAKERALSEQVESFWAQFAAEGDPDDGSEPTWVPFTAAKPVRLNLSSERSVLKNFRDAECGLWHKYYDGEFRSPD